MGQDIRMTGKSTTRRAVASVLGRLSRDRSGNTLAMVAAALGPILAMVGSGIDMGRSYLSETRLQQACDAGVLAARKKLGSSAAVTGVVPADVATVGNKFFNINFRAGVYGTQNRNFVMTLENDYSISGVAKADVPTTIMKVFGYSNVPVVVQCEARLNFSNTDIMMVLDTTESMNDSIKGVPKINTLRSVVKSFHAQLEASKAPSTVIRYGFVPYSSNVNVGYLLKSGWMVDSWKYQGRVAHDTGTTTKQDQYDNQYRDISGTYNYFPAYFDDKCPKSTDVWTLVSSTTDSNGYTVDIIKVTGTQNWCTRPGADSTRFSISGVTFNNYVYEHKYKYIGTVETKVYDWTYKPVTLDVSSFKGATNNDPYVGGSISVPMAGWPGDPQPLVGNFRGCIEERDTYQITDYSNVDFTKALDLDIDRVPTPGVPATQWRPMLHEIAFDRGIDGAGNGSFIPAEITTWQDYFQPNNYGMSNCPSPAKKLAPLNATEVQTYVDGLVPGGSTYHDIGMIWGGRLLSATGLFAAENADAAGKKTSRHLIFLTDGDTDTLDLTYATYGVEPLDQRRWDGGNSPKLNTVVEKRFAVACDEVKKRNITVWVIAFGTKMRPMFSTCAGAGHYFQADDADALTDIFSSIAAAMGDLRVSK
jgi:Flp pilus assembly protein TadG